MKEIKITGKLNEIKEMSKDEISKWMIDKILSKIERVLTKNITEIVNIKLEKTEDDNYEYEVSIMICKKSEIKQKGENDDRDSDAGNSDREQSKGDE